MLANESGFAADKPNLLEYLWQFPPTKGTAHGQDTSTKRTEREERRVLHNRERV